MFKFKQFEFKKNIILKKFLRRIVTRYLSFPYSFLSNVYSPTLRCKFLFLLRFFYSIIYYDYQVLALALYGVTLRSFGREPVSRTEQRTECKFLFFFYIYIFFSFFLFSRHLFSDQQQLFFASSATHKREMRAPSLSLPRLLNNLTIFFCGNANDGSQHLRDTLPFFSSLFFTFISFFRYMLSMSLSTC